MTPEARRNSSGLPGAWGQSIMSKPQGQAWASYQLVIVGGLVLVVAVVAFVLLVIPALMDGPPDIGPGYELFDDPYVSTTVEPGRNQAIELSGVGISLFIPAGAFSEPGQIILKERRPDLIPDRWGNDYIRVKAVDILFMDGEGRSLSSAPLDESVLLCFDMTPEQWAASSVDPDSMVLQAHHSGEGSSQWKTVSTAPGWKPNQLCSMIERFSLFALAQRNDEAPGEGQKVVPSPSPNPTQTPLQLYSPPGSDS